MTAHPNIRSDIYIYNWLYQTTDTIFHSWLWQWLQDNAVWTRGNHKWLVDFGDVIVSSFSFTFFFCKISTQVQIDTKSHAKVTHTERSKHSHICRKIHRVRSLLETLLWFMFIPLRLMLILTKDDTYLKPMPIHSLFLKSEDYSCMGHTFTLMLTHTVNVEFPVHLICISLEWGSKPEHLRETIAYIVRICIFSCLPPSHCCST